MVDIVIVNWNSGHYLTKCIDSIFPNSNRQAIGWFILLIIIHQISRLKKIGDYEISIISNTENNGFFKGVNQGFELCESPFVLLLNPDTQLFDTHFLIVFHL